MVVLGIFKRRGKKTSESQKNHLRKSNRGKGQGFPGTGEVVGNQLPVRQLSGAFAGDFLLPDFRLECDFVLAVVSREQQGTYGYKITQDVRGAIDISESTLYPVLRRLLKEECLESYDMAIDGRNRRYYKITENGRLQLNLYRSEWRSYSLKISRILEEAD